MKIRVFVLTQQGVDKLDNVTLDILGVFTTKTAAKELFKKKRAEIREFYETEYEEEPKYEDEDGFYTSWSISCEDSRVFDELLITEKVIDSYDEGI